MKCWHAQIRPGFRLIALALVLVLVLTACGPANQSGPAATTSRNAPGATGERAAIGQPLQVVATTTIVGDVVRNIAGDKVQLTVLMPPGADPHSFEPTPQDVAAIANADIVFINGVGLEKFLEPLLENAGGDARTVSVSEGVATREFAGEEEHAGEDEHEGDDPHVWFNPLNVVVWTDNIEKTLSELDPNNAEAYRSSAEAYKQQLAELDNWIQGQVTGIPENRRTLVVDHALFGYFADRYGFEQVGAVIPGVSTMAEPSAQEIAALEETMRALQVPAIFVGTTVNPTLAERVAEDTGTRLVRVFTDSLSPPDGPASSYLALMRYDVSAFVDAFSQ
ncbi:MAG: metal ABC transporter substrate-binding protein [Ardenticatenaceae bacterium]|nr:metal ABC transporter substrate-binding protein [Ardenticatenaceae bacterium]